MDNRYTELYDKTEKARENVEKKWLFPYEYINTNDRIILYGAGDVGTYFYNKIKHEKVCSVILWVDRRAKDIGYPVEEPSLIFCHEFDKLLLAISDKKTANDCAMDLIDQGIPQDKIVFMEHFTRLANTDLVFMEDYDKASEVKWSDYHETIEFNEPVSVTSCICNQEFFDRPFVQ